MHAASAVHWASRHPYYHKVTPGSCVQHAHATVWGQPRTLILSSNPIAHMGDIQSQPTHARAHVHTNTSLIRGDLFDVAWVRLRGHSPLGPDCRRPLLILVD